MQRPLPSALFAALELISRVPYENLSKIAAFACNGSSRKALERSMDLEGQGGTCYSLTHALHLRLEKEGLSTRFLMADKGHWKDVHCGLLLEWEGLHFLLDPGYLIYQPLRLPEGGLSVGLNIPPNQVQVVDLPAGARWRLFSGMPGRLKHRFDFRKRPVSQGEFMRCWEASYHLEMMHYPVLNRSQGGVQYYLQKRNLVIRTSGGSDLRRLSRGEFLPVATDRFGLAPSLVEEALAVVLKGNKDFFGR